MPTPIPCSATQLHSTPLLLASRQRALQASKDIHPARLCIRARELHSARRFSQLRPRPAALYSPVNQTNPVCKHRPLPRNSPIPPLPVENSGICCPVSMAPQHGVHPTHIHGRAPPHCLRTSLHRRQNALQPRRRPRGALGPTVPGIRGSAGSGSRGKGVLAAIQHRGFPGDHSAQY